MQQHKREKGDDGSLPERKLSWEGPNGEGDGYHASVLWSLRGCSRLGRPTSRKSRGAALQVSRAAGTPGLLSARSGYWGRVALGPSRSGSAEPAGFIVRREERRDVPCG
ncbi:hypothetical protein NDU88_010004 [Pleurodeles waltl]|uniref:Uncharacterized protein n=1 Tax=Pleurodeles waltl TaxID=8319 RepID=A0AAV7QT61_PLEWA|nr:hypothetical protein NDU88_010004 [Pleurodeles waltl]